MSKLPDGAPLPPGWGEDRRGEAEKLWELYTTASTDSMWSLDNLKRKMRHSPELLTWLEQTNGWAGMEAETARQVKIKAASREADKRLADEAAKRRPPVVWKNGTWLNGQQFGPVAWAVTGWFPEGMTFLGGGPKAGKSWLSQAAGLAIASGRMVLGSLPAQEPRPVMYFALEDSDRRIKSRSAELGWPELPELFWYTTKAAPDQVLSEMRAFLARYADQRPVAVIDTWGKIQEPAIRGETTYDRDYRLGSAVKDCVDDHPGSSVIINHHTRKEGAADFIDTLSGTFGVAGSADTIAILTRKRGELSGLIQITGRDVEEGTYALCGFPAWELDGAGLTESASRGEAAVARVSLGDRSAQVLDLVTAKGEALTAEVALALGISSDTASTYLGRLAAAGRIEKTGRGKWRALGVGTVGSVGVGSVGKGADQVPYDSPVSSVGSVGIPNIPTEQTGDTRARAREAFWYLRPDGAYDWATMWAARDPGA